MSDIAEWADTEAGNSKGSSPDHAVENQSTLGQLNNCMRETQAATRRWYDSPSWRQHTDDPANISTSGVDSVTVLGDWSAFYKVGQRVKITDTTTKYGTISNLSVNTDTTLTLTLDDGTADLAAVTEIWAGIPKNGSEVGGIADDVLTADGVGNIQSSGRAISDTYQAPQDPLDDPDLSLSVPSMKAVHDALRTPDAGESGAWTPRLITDTSDGTNATYSAQSGTYYTIGNLVFVAVRIQVTFIGNVDNTSDALQIVGLPPGLEAGGLSASYAQTIGPLHEYSFKSGTASGVPDGGVSAMINDGTRVIRLKQPARNGDGTMVNVNGDTCNDNTLIQFSGVYLRAGV